MSNDHLSAAMTRVRTLVSTYACGLLIATAVTGGGSDDSPPTPGRLSLEFVSMSDAEVVARLGNGSDRPIFIQGSRTFSRAIQVSGSNAQVVCVTSPGRSESALFGFSDGPQPRFVELPPNSEAKVIISTTFPQEHKGSRCSLELTLKDGTSVGPTEFFP
jgi:hypothetical protein